MSNPVNGSNQATGSHQEHHRQHRVGWLRASVLGAISSYLSGAKMLTGIVRVGFWGASAMATTALVGIAFDVAV